MPSVRDAQKSVEAKLPSGESLVGAFIGSYGPRPGVEALGVLAFTAGLFTNRDWIAVLLGVAVFAGVAFRRRYVTVARTDRNVLVFHHGRRTSLPAEPQVDRQPLNSIGQFDDNGDAQVSVGFLRLWVSGHHQDEARRVSRL